MARPVPRTPRPTRSIPTATMYVVLALSLLGLAAASSGDRLIIFEDCTNACLERPCNLSPVLRLLGWTCAADCDYQCAHEVTDLSDRGEIGYHQFFGKWAFWRLFGIQEPFSVLFSLGNLWIHWRGLKMLERKIPDSNKLKVWLKAAAWIQMNTWLWSSVFHTRDVPWTEKLDYFSAMITVAYMLLYAILRIFGVQTPHAANRPLRLFLCLLVGLFVLSHFIYVSSLPRFPYGYHVGVAMVLGLIGNVMWILWSLSFVVRLPTFRIGDKTLGWPWPYGPNWNPMKSRRPRGAFTPAILTLLTTAAMSLELLDFPPLLRAIDAHSLWHLATIPLSAAWWDFLIQDTNDLQAHTASPLSGGSKF